MSRRSSAFLWLLLAILIIVLAFYFGLRVGEGSPAQPATGVATSTATTTGGTLSSYYSSPAQWETYTDTGAGYSIAFPIDFAVDQPNSPAPSTNWLTNNVDQSPGILTFTLTIPAAFEPQTNFVGAMLTVGYSQNDKAVADCLVAQNGEATSTGSAGSPQATETVNNANFTVFTSSSPGAGQLYDTTSYRTTYAGACYAVEYTVHSAQLGNFPSSYDLQLFDEGQVDAVMNNIVGTFTFL